MKPDWSLMVLKLRSKFRYYRHLADAMEYSNPGQLKLIANGKVTDPKYDFAESLKAFYISTIGGEIPMTRKTK